MRLYIDARKSGEGGLHGDDEFGLSHRPAIALAVLAAQRAAADF
jgi:hypothetical protein